MSAFEGSHERLEQILQNPQGDVSEEDCEFIQRFAGEVFESIADVKKIPEVIERLDNIDRKIDKEVDRGQHGFNEVREAYRKLGDKVNSHDRRISDMDSRLKHLENLSTHTKLAVDQNTAMQQQHFELTKSINSQLQLLAGKTSDTSKKADSSSKIPALPWQAWLAIALVVIAALSMATGQFDTFMSAFDKSKVEAKK